MLRMVVFLFALLPLTAQIIPSGVGSQICTLTGTSTNGYVLTTDGAGGCTWQTSGGASVNTDTIKNATFLTDSGSANLVSGTTTTAYPGAYATGQHVIFTKAVTNSGATQININSLGAKSLTKLGATALAAGNLVSGTEYIAVYDGTQFQVLNYTLLATDIPGIIPASSYLNSLNNNGFLYLDGSGNAQSASGTARLGVGQMSLTQTALATTTTPGLSLINSTAAALGAQQVSPALLFEGNGWKTTATAASQAVDCRQYLLPVQGTANPTGQINMDCALNGGSFSTLLAFPFTASTTSGMGIVFGTTGQTGILQGANTELDFYANSGRRLSLQTVNGGLLLANTFQFAWSSNSDPAAAAQDVGLFRVSSGKIGVSVSSTNAATGELDAGVLAAYNSTATTGVTTLTCQDGAGQSSTACLQVKNNAGTTNFSVTGAGALLASSGIFSGDVHNANSTLTLSLGSLGSAANNYFAIVMGNGTYTNSSGSNGVVKITPTYNQTSTAGATDLLINRTQTAVGSGAQLLIDAQVGGVSQFSVNNVGLATHVDVVITNQKATTGQRFACLDTNGKIVSSTTACVGT